MKGKFYLLFLINLIVMQIQAQIPDPYEKGKEGKVHIWIDESTNGEWTGITFLAYDFDKMQDRNINTGFQKTYKTIGVGEYDYTSENLQALYRSRMGMNYNWLNWDEANIAAMTKSYDPRSTESPLKVNDFRNTYGNWFTLLPMASAYLYPEKRIFRDQENGTIQEGWTLPTIADIMQIIGQAPSTGNINTDVLNFIGASQGDVPSNHQSDWYHDYKNISGLTLTPLGSREPEEGNLATSFYTFKLLSKLRLKDSNESTFAFYRAGSYYSPKDYHYTQVRYCKVKTDAELGYKLYIDNCNDAVVMYPYNLTTKLTELPKGLERGIALRYANRSQMKIYRKWSEICREADQIRKAIPTLPAFEELSFPECGNENGEGGNNSENESGEENENNQENNGEELEFFSGCSDAIDVISFVYDAAGNRVKKEIILSTRSASMINYSDPFTEQLDEHKIVIYPNPTQGQLRINIEGLNVSTAKFVIYNLRGQVVSKKQTDSGQIDIDISDVPNGVYILWIDIDGKMSSWKIIKQ